MNKFKVAVLEDDQNFLKELVDNLRRTDLVEVIVKERGSSEFIESVRLKSPDALLLDIALVGDTLNGIDVANLLKLPVLFLSSHRRDYLEAIDNLKLLGTFPVEEIGKTPDTEKLKTILKTFIPRVRDYQKTLKVKIKPKGEHEISINPRDVAFIESVKDKGNHYIKFINRKPIETADTNFDWFRQNGFPEQNFYRFGKPYLINITLGEYKDGTIVIYHMDDHGKTVPYPIKVPIDKRKEVKDKFLK
jgi:chemotaxis response regulator CheB